MTLSDRVEKFYAAALPLAWLFVTLSFGVLLLAGAYWLVHL